MPRSEQSHWFAKEVKPHESSLRAHLRNLFPSLPDIDDLVQEAYLRLIRTKETGRITYIKAFLFTAARNVALDIFRRRQVVSIESVADLAELSVPEEGHDMLECVCRQQELDLLAASVRALPDRCRQVLTLRLLYGLSQKEIAAHLNISPHTVKAQLAKGTRRCTEYFAARGYAHAHRQSSHSGEP